MSVVRGYKGHYIIVSSANGIEEIQAHLCTPDGRFDLLPCKTYAGAQRAITKHNRTLTA
jgi:hypothetical protein